MAVDEYKEYNSGGFAGDPESQPSYGSDQSSYMSMPVPQEPVQSLPAPLGIQWDAQTFQHEEAPHWETNPHESQASQWYSQGIGTAPYDMDMGVYPSNR